MRPMGGITTEMTQPETSPAPIGADGEKTLYIACIYGRGMARRRAGGLQVLNQSALWGPDILPVEFSVGVLGDGL